MSEDFFTAATEGKKGAKKTGAKPAPVKKPEWPDPYKPRMNFMPEHRRKVEYGRRAVRNGVMTVLVSFLAVTFAAVTIDGYGSHLQGDMNKLSAEVAEANSVLEHTRPVTQYYANYIDQRQAVSRQFDDELSASRIFSEIDGLAGSSVKTKDISYDLTNTDCLTADPFFESENTGCVSISGEASSPAALAGFVAKMNEGSALFQQAHVSEATAGSKGMMFTLTAGYTAEAESKRGEQFTPTDDELSKVVKKIPPRPMEGQVDPHGK